MIFLLHGDDTEASRRALGNLQREFEPENVRLVNGKSVDAAGLRQALESPSFFGKKHAVVIEGFLAGIGKKTKRLEELCSALDNTSADTTVVLWEPKEASAATIKRLGPGLREQVFKIPTVLFTFLDSLAPSRTNQLLSLFQSLCEHTASELIWTLLVRRVRQLLQLKAGVAPVGLAPWQVSRLTKQTRFFTMEQIAAMETQLLELEYALKTGHSPYTLSQQIERFLIDL